MDPIDSKVARVLVTRRLIDNEQFRAVQDHLVQWGGRFHLMVVKMGFVTEEQVAGILASVSNLPLISLAKMQIDPLALQKLPAEFCSKNCVFPCAIREGGTTLWLAMADPLDNDIKNEARILSGLRLLRPLVGRPSEIREYIEREYGSALTEVNPFSENAIDLSLSEEEEEEEFKVVSLMSGKTLVKHVGGVRQEGALEVPPAPPLPSEMPEPPLPARDASPEIPAELDAWLDRLMRNQRKATTIITNLTKMLIEKGFFSADEFGQQMKK
ncbi:MAG: hypothetical protein JXR96_24290 [Deltaproteobacteria bacterium]|nr:hypothetical protein [Deltaproteobacteria bacterium]